ncbi:hypothetical protein CHISP_2194 [Chitinispirillum alkaliphilum]|nr:hypothetical protein CHISP_2194 [Chitinispirillum alkaliphilum]
MDVSISGALSVLNIGRKSALLCHMFIICCVAAVLSQEVLIPCVPSVIEDHQVLHYLGLGQVSGVEYRACLSGDKNQRKLILFRDGTQIGELDPQKTERLLVEHKNFGLSLSQNRSPRALGGSAGKTFFRDTIFNPQIDNREKIAAIMESGAWPAGFEIIKRLEFAGSTTALLRNSVAFNGMYNYHYFYIGAGLQRNWYSGGLPDILLSNEKNNYLNHAFSFTLGVPFVRYELKQAGWILPEYFWLEDDIIAVTDKRVEPRTVGQISRQWDKSHKKNFSHALYFKAGHFGFSMLFDFEMYSRTIYQFQMDNLPSVFGTWGASLTFAADAWIPGVWLDVPKFETVFFRGRNFQVPVEVEPLQLHFHYWNLRRYNLGCSMRINFDVRKNSQERL